MATECPSLVRGNVLRVTRLNGCGQPVYGEGNQVVSDGFVTISMSPEVEEGEEVNVVKANGKTCVSDKPCDQLKWYTVEYEFCEVDPDLLQIMNPTWEKILDNQGDTCGIDAVGELDCSTGYALELWMDVYGETDACVGQEAQGVWGYMLLPYNVGGAPGDFEVGNEGISFNLTGRTKAGSNWRRGPYNVTLGENNVPSPLLKPVTKKTHFQLFTTAVRPPEPECGAQPVDRPTPEKADLKVTGVPNEEPRRTVRLFVDNHGFGPVLIDWGDGTSDEESIEGRWVNHVYGKDGEYTITVRDKQTPAVKTSVDVTVPLPADEPKLKLECSGDESTPLKIRATVTMPPHSDGKGRIDWGDGKDPEEFDTSGASGGVANLTHTYAAPSIYTVSVRRQEQNRFRARDAIQVPCDGDGDGGGSGDLKVSADADKADKSGRTVVLTINRDSGDGGGEGPKVKVAADKEDESGRTAVVTIGDASDLH